ncbi:MAG: efflux transporter outer membrane subunit [Planctomycetaceae bacterium]|nr:efflux transporter outer membrane subunit [Planctomycetaceae bacterium]
MEVALAVFRHRLLRQLVLVMATAAVLSSAGCTSFREYVRNGFKVGPNYCAPAGPVADHWIDQADIHVAEGQDLSRWWSVFCDPTLDHLILCAYRQNLTLREASFRILEARALLGIARGEIFPQTQTATGGYQRVAVSQNTAQGPVANPFFNQWNFGFNLAWEVDFWGRLRRAIAAADAQLDASVADYDQVLVTLLGDVASNYIQIRTDQERLRYLRQNVTILELVLKWTQRREQVGFKTTPLDVHQTESNLEQTIAGIPQLEMDLREAENRLCVLLGMPPVELGRMLGETTIPGVPRELAIGVPCELLRRRPDVRRAERLAAAQSEQIGIAVADLYPAFTIDGSFGWEAANASNLISPKSFNGNIGPTFRWNLLNYGRIGNNVRYHEARFQELVATYQRTVLQAAQEVEDGLVTFLKAQDRTQHLEKSVNAAGAAVRDMFLPTAIGQPGFDFNRFALIEQNRVTQQDLLAQSRGQIDQGLILVYRALGGGWEIRQNPPEIPPLPEVAPSVVPEGAEELQKLRNLLEPQAAQELPTPERLPKPDNEPMRP